MCDPILISSRKSRTVERAASESTVIRGSVSKRFLIAPFEHSSASISSRFPLINCSIFCVCYYCLILQPPSYYYLMQRNSFEVFKPIYSLLNIFTSLKNKLSLEDTNKTFFAANNCFPSHIIEQEPRKTATRHPVERSFRNQRVRHIFCKRIPTALKSQIHPCTLRL